MNSTGHFHAPVPGIPFPGSILIELCAEVFAALSDLAVQSRAALDREEVLAKLDDITDRVAQARAAYLAAIDGR